MKRGRPAFSITQDEAVAKVLEREAKMLDCTLETVELSTELLEHPHLTTHAQKQNASLAIQLANAYLGLHGDELSHRDIIEGASLCKWPGRFQRVDRGGTVWFLDCAHNALSILVALSWYISEVRSDGARADRAYRRILIFGHESARDTCSLISLIAEFCLKETFHFDLVILSPYVRYGKSVYSLLLTCLT